MVSSAQILIIYIITMFVHVKAVSVGDDLSMSLKEKRTLDKFRQRVTPLLNGAEEFMKTDLYLIRWLRAKKFNVNEAVEMFKNNLKWREAKNMKGIQQENFEDVHELFPATADSYDKEGRPVGTLDVYDWDIRSYVLAGKGPRLLRYMDMMMDNITRQVFEQQKKGKQVTQWNVLANAESFNMIKHGCTNCMPIWIQFLHSFENHFPGWMNELIIIESNAAVYTMFGIVRNFLSPHTQEAMKIFGMNKKQWMSYMDKRISRSERRSEYGGYKPTYDS